ARLRRLGGGAAPTRGWQDELLSLVEPAKVAQVLGRPAGAAGQAHERRAIPEGAISDLGPVIRGEPRHRPTLLGTCFAAQRNFAAQKNKVAKGRIRASCRDCA